MLLMLLVTLLSLVVAGLVGVRLADWDLNRKDRKKKPLMQIFRPPPLEPEPDLDDDLFGPTPGGELEWAYSLLERAEREEREAKRQEFIKRCKEAGHGELHEITSFGSLARSFVCDSCGDTIYKLRFEEKRGGYPWPKEIAPLDVPAEWLTLGLLVDPTLVTEWTKGKQEEGGSL